MFLPLSLDEASAALKTLDLGAFGIEFVTIPADGGCVVAVIERRRPARQAVRRPRRWLEEFRYHRAISQAFAALQQHVAIADTGMGSA